MEYALQIIIVHLNYGLLLSLESTMIIIQCCRHIATLTDESEKVLTSFDLDSIGCLHCLVLQEIRGPT